MNAAETVAKLEVMRDEVREVARTAPNCVDFPVGDWMGILAQAVDALTYVVIEQLRDRQPSGTIEFGVVACYEGQVMLKVGNGPSRTYLPGETLVLSDQRVTVGP